MYMGYDIVSYGKMVKIKAMLGHEGTCASVKGKLDARGKRNHQGCEVRVEGLALMDQGNGEEQTMLRLMVYEGHMKL